jgi:hypothetical protein
MDELISWHDLKRRCVLASVWYDSCTKFSVLLILRLVLLFPLFQHGTEADIKYGSVEGCIFISIWRPWASMITM